jgi:hypothetical protein
MFSAIQVQLRLELDRNTILETIYIRLSLVTSVETYTFFIRLYGDLHLLCLSLLDHVETCAHPSWSFGPQRTSLYSLYYIAILYELAIPSRSFYLFYITSNNKN